MDGVPDREQVGENRLGSGEHGGVGRGAADRGRPWSRRVSASTAVRSAGAAGLAGGLGRRAPATGADELPARGAVLRDDRERLQVRLVATMRAHPVRADGLGIESTHRRLAADRAGASHQNLGMIIRKCSGRSGPNGAVLYHAPGRSPAGPAGTDEGEAVPDGAIAGRTVVTRRAIIDIVRRVTLGSYGVVGFAGGWPDRLLGMLERRPGGLRISLHGDRIGIAM